MKMTLEELRQHQPQLLDSFLIEYSPERACELANNILIGLDNLEQLEESYDYTRTETMSDELESRIRKKAKIIAGLHYSVSRD